MPKFCTKCGAKMQDDDLFCSECGSKLRSESRTGQQPASEQKKTENIETSVLMNRTENSDWAVNMERPNTKSERKPGLKQEEKCNAIPKKSSKKKWAFALFGMAVCTALIAGVILFGPNIVKNGTLLSGLGGFLDSSSTGNIVYIKDNKLYLTDEKFQNSALIAENVLSKDGEPLIDNSQTHQSGLNNMYYDLTFSTKVDKNRIFLCTGGDRLNDQYGQHYSILENGSPIELKGVMLEPLKICKWDGENTLLALDMDNRLFKYSIDSSEEELIAEGAVYYNFSEDGNPGFNKFYYDTTDDQSFMIDYANIQPLRKNGSAYVISAFPGFNQFLIRDDYGSAFIDTELDTYIPAGTGYPLSYQSVNDGTLFFTSMGPMPLSQ